MKQTFNYVPKDGIVQYLTSFLLPILLIVVPIVYPFNIGFRRFVLIPYPYSAILLVIIGIAVLLYQVNRLKKEKALKSAPVPIVIEDGKVTFGGVSKGEVVEKSFLLSEVTNVSYDSEDEELTVNVIGSTFSFDADFFDNKTEFNSFMELVKGNN